MIQFWCVQLCNLTFFGFVRKCSDMWIRMNVSKYDADEFPFDKSRYLIDYIAGRNAKSCCKL